MASGLVALIDVSSAREIDRLVVGVLVLDHLAARSLDRLLELVGESLSVRSRVVDHGEPLELQRLDRVFAERLALLAVVGHQAKRGLETLLRVLDVGRHRELRDAGVVVHRGRRNRDARIEVADDAVDLGVDQFLRDERPHLRVGLIVFGHQLELDRLAADLDALRVELVDRHLRAVLVVLAVVRLAAGQRRREADLDDFLRIDGRARERERDCERGGEGCDAKG